MYVHSFEEDWDEILRDLKAVDIQKKHRYIKELEKLDTNKEKLETIEKMFWDLSPWKTRVGFPVDGIPKFWMAVEEVAADLLKDLKLEEEEEAKAKHLAEEAVAKHLAEATTTGPEKQQNEVIVDLKELGLGGQCAHSSNQRRQLHQGPR